MYVPVCVEGGGGETEERLRERRERKTDHEGETESVSVSQCVSVCDSVCQCQCTPDRVSVCMRVDMCTECVHVNLWPACHVTLTVSHAVSVCLCRLACLW